MGSSTFCRLASLGSLPLQLAFTSKGRPGRATEAKDTAVGLQSFLHPFLQRLPEACVCLLPLGPLWVVERMGFLYLWLCLRVLPSAVPARQWGWFTQLPFCPSGSLSDSAEGTPGQRGTSSDRVGTEKPNRDAEKTSHWHICWVCRLLSGSPQACSGLPECQVPHFANESSNSLPKLL